MGERHIEISRTARYYISAEPASEVEELCYVMHGYGQLASFFIKHFEGIASSKRLVIAPEGLSRFYLGGVFGRVGATWMTKEDREHEIKDYVRYLDHLHASLLRELPVAPKKITLLGFSQGCPTAWRWFHQGQVACDHLVFCSGSLPKEDSAEVRKKLADVEMDLIYGDDDEYIKEDFLSAETERLKGLKADLRLHTFSGGHSIHRPTLARIFKD